MSVQGHPRKSILGVEFNPQVLRDPDSSSLHSGLRRGHTLSRKQPQGPDPDSYQHANEQSFWKFHMIKFGPSMYLTTNPSPRHLHCRNAPGYFIRLEGSTTNYTMVFEDIETGELLVSVQKRYYKKRSELHYILHKQRMVHGGAVVDAEIAQDKDSHSVHSQESKNSGEKPHGTSATKKAVSSEPIFRGILYRKPITEEMIPAATMAPQINLQGTMIDGQRWSVGSIPRVRDSRLRTNEVKYISKLNVYFHCKAESSQVWKGEVSSQVKAVFRECATKSKKRLLRQINRLSRVPSAADLGPSRQLESPFDDINYYSKCGDGLYYDETPADDEPDHHHKLGWLTVYDDPRKYRLPGFFDLVVALTVATSHENNC